MCIRWEEFADRRGIRSKGNEGRQKRDEERVCSRARDRNNVKGEGRERRTRRAKSEGWG